MAIKVKGVEVFTNDGALAKQSISAARDGAVSDTTRTDELLLFDSDGGDDVMKVTVDELFDNITVGNIETKTNSIKIGKAAGRSETVDGGNVFVGLNAGENAVSATRSTFIGKTAGIGADGDGNTYIGADTASANVGQTAFSNTAVGAAALNKIESGGSNVVAGVAAGNRVSSGNANTLIGSAAGEFITTGSNNIVIGGGSNTGAADVSNHIVIGNNTASPPVLGDHMVIGNNGNSWILGTPDFNIQTKDVFSTGSIVEATYGGNRVAASDRVQSTLDQLTLQPGEQATIAELNMAILSYVDLQVAVRGTDGSIRGDHAKCYYNGTSLTLLDQFGNNKTFNTFTSSTLNLGPLTNTLRIVYFQDSLTLRVIAFLQTTAPAAVTMNSLITWDASYFPPAP